MRLRVWADGISDELRIYAIGMKDSAKAIHKPVERSRVKGTADDMVKDTICSCCAFFLIRNRRAKLSGTD